MGPADGVAAVALGPAGDAGAHVVSSGLLGAVQGEVLWQEGAWADEAHVAAEHIPQLGELVEGRGADEAAYGGEAVGVGEEVAGGVAAVGHGLEFDEAEDFAVEAGAVLAEEGTGAVVGEVEPDGDGGEDGAEA